MCRVGSSQLLELCVYFLFWIATTRLTKQEHLKVQLDKLQDAAGICDEVSQVGVLQQQLQESKVQCEKLMRELKRMHEDHGRTVGKGTLLIAQRKRVLVMLGNREFETIHGAATLRCFLVWARCAALQAATRAQVLSQNEAGSDEVGLLRSELEDLRRKVPTDKRFEEIRARIERETLGDCIRFWIGAVRGTADLSRFPQEPRAALANPHLVFWSRRRRTAATGSHGRPQSVTGCADSAILYGEGQSRSTSRASPTLPMLGARTTPVTGYPYSARTRSTSAMSWRG
jgi:hypothetical protein